MQLNGIAQKLKFQGLKNKAKEFMEAIANDNGLTRDELEDRIVPDSTSTNAARASSISARGNSASSSVRT